MAKIELRSRTACCKDVIICGFKGGFRQFSCTGMSVFMGAHDPCHWFFLCLPTACTRKSNAVIWILIVPVLLLGLLLWLPLSVEIDTRSQVYRAGWQGIAAVRGIPDATHWHWFFKLFFWEWEWQPGRNAQPAQTKPSPQTATPPKKRRSVSMVQVKAMWHQLPRTIRVKRLWVDWDSGDFVLNAWLYPAFRMFSQGKRQLFVNFSGRQDIALLIQARPGNLIAAAIRIFFTSKNSSHANKL